MIVEPVANAVSRSILGTIAMLFITLLATFIVQDDVKLDFREAAVIAKNPSICKVIKWDTKSRDNVCRVIDDYNRDIDKLHNTYKDDPNRLVAIAKHRQEITQASQARMNTITNAEVISFVAKGYFLLEPYLAISKQSVKTYCKIAPGGKLDRVITKYFSELNDKFQVLIDKYVSENSVSWTSIDSLVFSLSRDAAADLKKILMENTDDEQRAALFLLFTQEKIEVSPKQMILYPLVVDCFVKSATKHRKYVDRFPLVVKESVLEVASLSQVISMVPLVGHDLDEVKRLYLELLLDYQTTSASYDVAIADGKLDTMRNAHSFYQKCLIDQVKKYDKLLAKSLQPDIYERLVQITYQVYGVRYLFDQSVLSQRYSISEKQYLQASEHVGNFNKEVSRLAESKPSERNERVVDSNRVKTVLRIKLSKTLYDSVLDEKQKALWDKRVGKPLSDEQLIAIILELNEANRKYRR